MTWVSLKPKKKGDLEREQARLAQKMQRRPRPVEILHPLPPYMVIFCEGTKTEPNYLQSIVRRINEKYDNYTRQDRITVHGTGRNTRGLLEFAQSAVRSEYPQTQEVWLVYDMDEFPSDHFDNTQFKAETLQGPVEYHVAWSNECIEFWFLLHFQDLRADVPRSQYNSLLSGHLGEKYEKAMPDLYDRIHAGEEVAIRRARALYQEHCAAGCPPSQCRPATRMFELIERLNEFL